LDMWVMNIYIAPLPSSEHTNKKKLTLCKILLRS
jgi:hypothetical protein